MSSTNQSHATGGSVGPSSISSLPPLHSKLTFRQLVPDKAQEKLPQGVEENVPNQLHDTGSSGAKSHATGDSKVPKAVQEAVPKGLEKALPNKIHDTSGL